MLGRSHKDPELIKLLGRIGILASSIALEPGEFDVALDAPEHGVDVILSSPNTEGDSLQSSLMLTTVFFFSEGREGHKQYKLTLPAGLHFDMSRDEVFQQLGPPEFSSPILPVYRWTWHGTKLAVTFADGFTSIARVSTSVDRT